MNLWSGALQRYAEKLARESGRLIATLATTEGARRRIDWLFDVMFVATVDELEARGVARRVAADMLGVSHRTLQRRYAAAVESSQQLGRSVWIAVLDSLREAPCSRADLAAQHGRVPVVVFGAVINDMLESGWLEERDGMLHLAVETGRRMTDDELATYVGVRRRADPSVTAAQVAAEVHVAVERVEASWKLSSDLIVNARGDMRWMAMDRSAAMVFELLRGAANDITSGRFGASVWRVRLDDKSAEFQATLREHIQEVSAGIEEMIRPHATHDDTAPDARFWSFASFQTVDLDDEQSEA